MTAVSNLDLTAILTGLLITSITASFPDKSWIETPEFSVLQKVYDNCQDKNDFTGCLKDKAAAAITKAIDQDNVKIVDGLYFQRQNETEKESIMEISGARSWNDLSTIDRGLFEKLDKFLRSHVIKVDMSEGRSGDVGDGFEESRKKKKKKKLAAAAAAGVAEGINEGVLAASIAGGRGKKGKKDKKEEMLKYFVVSMMAAAGVLGPFLLNLLAAIAGHALVTSKVALTIATLISLKNVFVHDHYEKTVFRVHASRKYNRRNTYVVHPTEVDVKLEDPYQYYNEYDVKN